MAASRRACGPFDGIRGAASPRAPAVVIRRARGPSAALALVAALGCGGERAPTVMETSCPGPTSSDAERAARVIAFARRSAEGRALLVRAAGARLCFGEVAPSVVTSDGAVLLDRRLGDAEAAARLGHLLHHVAEGAPLDEGATDGRPCEERVADALVAEGRALALELRLRRELGVRQPRVRYEFEAPFHRAPEDRRQALIVAYLEAHPEGAPGVDGLANAYLARCREAREAAR